MTSLVDTHVLVFFLQGHRRLPRGLARRIEAPEHHSLVSIASLWEISIKTALGKLSVSYADQPEFPRFLEQAGFEILPIQWPAIRRASALTWHHRDPFDRLLVAEAQLRGIPILSFDEKLDAYGVERIDG